MPKVVITPVSPDEKAGRWDAAYAQRGVEGVSWYQPVPAVPLELIEALGVPRTAAVIDVGGGASLLADKLVRRGFSDVTVLDIASSALDATRQRIGARASVSFVQADLLTWRPSRRYDLWHDRAVFHFLVTDADRETYARTLREAVAPGGAVILATFAPDGPATCSGLPVLRYSIDDLGEILGGTFDQLESLREEHITPRGSTQPFTGSRTVSALVSKPRRPSTSRGGFLTYSFWQSDPS